ncbi:MAG: hypothetical protein LC715_02810 [Gammaproteobacteria bacterium]|nr:hypothetical protein [Gammaproteobacteria bacterium]
MTRSSLLLGSTLFLLSACAPAPAPAPQQLPFAEPGVSLSVTQSSKTCGPGGAYRANVAWQVPATMAPRLEVQVDASERKHFVRSTERSGQHETGEWVAAGLAFFLVDRDANKVLAAMIAGPGDCRSGPAS